MSFKSFIHVGKNNPDLAPLFADQNAFTSLIEQLAMLFRGIPIDKIAAIEGKGTVLGSAVAHPLQVGLIQVRPEGKLEGVVHSVTYVNYSKKEKILEIEKKAIQPGERILIIDDWAETGSTLHAAIQLVEKAGGIVVGIGVFMDETSPEVRASLARFNYRFLEQVGPHDIFRERTNRP